MEIKAVDIGMLFAQLERKGLSAQSILHIYNVLHKMFGDAVEFFELIDINPVRKRFRPKVHRIEREFLSPADSWRLLDSCKDHPLGAAVWISLLSGLRPGEVQALKWSAVDFERSQILIQATFNRKLWVMQDCPKQGDWGRAPMPAVLADFLRPKAKGRMESDFVCPNILGGMLSYESFNRRMLPQFCKQAGVKRITPHELRHSCTELYVQAGASAEDLRRLLNHKSLSATLHYMHRTDERLQGIALKVAPPKPPENPEGPKLHLRLVKAGGL